MVLGFWNDSILETMDGLQLEIMHEEVESAIEKLMVIQERINKQIKYYERQHCNDGRNEPKNINLNKNYV